MKSATLHMQRPAAYSNDPGLLSAWARRIILERLRNLRHGELVVNDGAGQQVFGRKDSHFPDTVTVTVTDPRFYTGVLIRGALGAGEAYMEGYWDCDDLTAFIELFLANRDHIHSIGSGMHWMTLPARLLQQFLRRNTLTGSRRNIEAHYDLGNELFELFLDSTMMYSCGIFPDARATLQDASEAKLESICRQLQLKPTDHVLEIGTGWGGFALYAARNYGCRVTTTTISGQQYAYARERIRQAGLEDRITLLCADYRLLAGSYDKLVSIEMIEAIGHRHFDTYFRKCSELLKPDGMMLLQSITIADQRYPAARNSIDFIKRYIFPGGCLPSNAALAASIARSSDLRIYHLHDIGQHYATTLRHWRDRFLGNIEQVRRLGYTERFIRMWLYYLAYCEGGFRRRVIGTVQLLLVKPHCRRPPLPAPGR